MHMRVVPCRASLWLLCFAWPHRFYVKLHGLREVIKCFLCGMRHLVGLLQLKQMSDGLPFYQQSNCVSEAEDNSR